MAKKISEDELLRRQQAQTALSQGGQETGGNLPPPVRDLPQGMPTLPQSMPGTDPAATAGVIGQAAPQGTIIGQREVSKAAQTLRDYKDGKTSLENRIIENEQWYKTRHWDYINLAGGNVRTVTASDGTQTKVPKNMVEPSSAWLFNALDNKHADLMDNFPSPVILPRERNDEDSAKTLSSVVPVIMERNEYEQTYSDCGWDYIKNGVSISGVFWDKEAESGLGDISVKPIDILNLFWQPGISNLQQSRNIFHVSLVDDDVLNEQYPALKGKLHSQTTIDVSKYIYDDTIPTENKSAVVDWYYKRRSVTGKNILHYCKFVGDTVLFASENDPTYQETGWYDHGEYPFDMDVLFPIKGSPCGFGYVDIMRQPQLYIDKLNQILLTNAFMAGKARYFIKNSGGVNEQEFADLSRDFVHVEGSLTDENLRQIEVNPLPDNYYALLEFKVNELKETSGNRDFNQGGTASGVTAASAIAALQEAGNKISRDMIKGKYRTYRATVSKIIELTRQFYDEAREFRITGDRGQTQFTTFSNAGLKDQIMPPAVPGEDLQAGYAPSVRRPIFDIVVKAEKTSPFSRAAQNELAKELYGAGFFDPQRADQALGALELMDFEGKEKVVERVTQGQTLLSIVMQQQAEMQKMAMIIQAVTGEDLTGGQQMSGQAGSGAQSSPASGKSSSGQTQAAAVKNQNTSYADRLAARSTPNMNMVNSGVKQK